MPNERWSLDFVHDTLQSTRRIRTLNIIDDFTREALAIEVDTSISAARVARVLDRIADERGLPKTIVMDNGTELTSLAMLAWAAKHRVKLHYIAPGKPTQNAFIESLRGKPIYRRHKSKYQTTAQNISERYNSKMTEAKDAGLTQEELKML